MSDSDDPTSWDASPVYELGNAFIVFGDLLDEKIADMSSALFDLGDGSWSGDASRSMSSAFMNGLRHGALLTVGALWSLGEAINYYAMLRSEQQETEAKQELASMLATVLGFALGTLLGLVGGMIPGLLSMLGELVSALASISAR